MFEANCSGDRAIKPLGRLAALLFVAGRLAAQTPAPATLVKAGRLLDPRTGNVARPAAVLVENGKIKEVGPPSRVEGVRPSGVKAIDLGKERSCGALEGQGVEGAKRNIAVFR